MFFFFKQQTAYEMRISDWSSDVCSSDLRLQKIRPGDPVYLGRKPTGTLVADALTPGRRLFMLSTGTGLAPFLSLARDPDIYERFNQIVIVHCVRRVSDLAFREELESQLAGDPLVQDQALLQFHYLPTVTREPFRTTGRIDALIEDGSLFGHPLTGPAEFDQIGRAHV